MTSTGAYCPSCGQAVDPQTRQCPHCGIDMALAAALAEKALTTSSLAGRGVPVAPEILVPRLGESLVERGYISADDLQRALVRHKEMIQAGHPTLVGQILLEMGLVKREHLDQVITAQILKLQAALHQSNRDLEKRVRERTKELQEALSRLTELNQLKSNFISNISHELRTPLTHLRGYLTLLSDGSLGDLSEIQKDAFEVLLRAEARLEQLIEDLIQFSLAARGELTLNLASVSMNDIIALAVSRSAKLAKARKVTLQASVAENLPLVLADAEKIIWIILQLLDNAIKFTPQDGWVKIEAIHEGRMVRTTVLDTGIGIAPGRLDEIFEPFHQLDGSDTRRFGGVGLGLALVRQIIEAHGSVITVRSKAGQGSRFEFTLPAVQLDHV